MNLYLKREAKIKDWEQRFYEKYGRKATLQDIEGYPKVKKIYQELKTLAATNNHHDPGLFNSIERPQESIDRLQRSDPIGNENNSSAIQPNAEVILPTPSKERSNKGLFKSLSSSNVLLSKRFAEVASQQSPSKKAKKESMSSLFSKPSLSGFAAPRRTTSFFASLKDSKYEELSNPLSAISNDTILKSTGLNTFSKSVSAPMQVPGVTIDEDETCPNDKNIIKKLISNEFQYGTGKNYQDFIPPSAMLKNEKTSLKCSPRGANSLMSPTLPPSKNWRVFKPIATPLKRVVEKAMKPVKPRAETFIAPHMFVNHRSLKRAASLTLPLPDNYDEFLTVEEKRQFAQIIKEKNPDAILDDTVSENLEDVVKDTAYQNVTENVEALMSAKKAPIRKTTKPKRVVPSEDYTSDDSESNVEKDSKKKQNSKSAARKLKSSKSEKTKSSKSEREENIAKDEKNGWESKKIQRAVIGGNQNYRAFNLKSKGKGQSNVKFGKNKFKKTKKLSSYSYKASDEQYLLAGYEDETAQDQIDDVVVEGKALEIDSSQFIVKPENTCKESSSEYSHLCSISNKYELLEENVQINLLEALKSFTGHSSFRNGQYEAISRILEYKSTLFILPTGGGKSLCYQLPAFILRYLPKKRHSMILVISPTISLMMDQVQNLPKKIRGACLSSSDQASTTNKVIEKVKNGEIDVLFISPERLRSDSFLNLIQNGHLPYISFVCIDEVHCLSEWSHNFRTSYLHLQSSLINTLQVGCILGLTGTATIASQQSICQMLAIDTNEGIIAQEILRDNLLLSASMIDDNENREAALADLLRSEPYKNYQSIIIYVMFQNQADQLAQYLRIRNFDSESYHAGKSPEIRSQTQSRFLRGTLRILTATVAFGMGINKPNVDAVIHYSLPKSIENYIQETGRAGRDGRAEAHCHVFVTRQDYIKHRSLVYSEYFDEGNLMKFLRALFSSKDRIVGMFVDEAEKMFDVKETVLATVLSHIELSHPDIFHALPVMNGTLTLYFSTGTTLEDLCKEIDWFWEISRYHARVRGGIEFDVIKVANAANILPRELLSVLWNLQIAKKIKFKSDRKTFIAQVLKPDLIDAGFMREICTALHNKLVQMEQIRVLKLDETYEMLNRVAVPSTEMINEKPDLEEKRTILKTSILQYFQRTGQEELNASQLKSKYGFRDPLLIKTQKTCQMAVEIAIKQFVRTNYDILDSGRTVARIFHGISTPKYSAFEWCKTEFWGKYTHFNHVEIARMANKTILDFKAKHG